MAREPGCVGVQGAEADTPQGPIKVGPIEAGASVDLGMVVSVYGRAPSRNAAAPAETCFAAQGQPAADAWATEH